MIQKGEVGRSLEPVSNGRPREMVITSLSLASAVQNPAYRLALFLFFKEDGLLR